MFKAVGSFFKSFLTKEEVLPEQIDVVYEPLDIDRAVKVLKIKEIAKEDGEKENPHTEETNIDSFQLRIYKFIETEVSQRNQKLNENLIAAC